jgi:ribosome-binding protein aMBF1 (putative translation factor)
LIVATDQSGRRPKFDPEQRDGKADAQDEHRAFNTTVGEAIRRARQEHGWTQAFLAEQAGLSPNYVARLERGELGPSLFVASRICEALTIEIDSLVVTPTGTQTRVKATATGGTKRRALTG